MSDMWLTISCRRSIIKCICLPLLAVINTLLEYIIILPELFDLFFSVYEIHI